MVNQSPAITTLKNRLVQIKIFKKYFKKSIDKNRFRCQNVYRVKEKKAKNEIQPIRLRVNQLALTQKSTRSNRVSAVKAGQFKGKTSVSEAEVTGSIPVPVVMQVQ